MALCVFDIHPDGSATVPKDTDLTGPGIYRWWHYDLSDPELSVWSTERLDPVPASALLQPETRPRCDSYKQGLILNLRGINMNTGQKSDEMVSVRIWVESNVIVTVRVRKVFALQNIRECMERNEPPPSPPAFLQHLIGRLTERIQNEVMAITRQTEAYETDLEQNTDVPAPRELPEARRRVIKLRRYLEPQQYALSRLAKVADGLIPEQDALEMRELANRTTIAVEELAAQQERIVAVQDEYDMQVAQKQARHGYNLSVAAAVFLPVGFLTGLFGVNVGGVPGLDSPWAFTILCLAMTAVCAVLVMLLKLKRWL